MVELEAEKKAVDSREQYYQATYSRNRKTSSIKRVSLTAPIGQTNCLLKCFAKLQYFFACEWCTCPAFWWLRVRHLQIVLVSMLSSLISVTSNFRLLFFLMTADYTRGGQHWSRVHLLLLDSSYLLGYAMMNIGNGFYIAHLDRKLYVCGLFLVVGGIMAAIPTLARKGGVVVVALARVVIGCSMGAIVPMLHWFIFRWSTRKEIVMAYAIAMSGTYMGQFISLVLITTSYHRKISLDIDFYILAFYATCVVITWMIFGSKHPDDCSYISEKERQLIENKRLAISENLEANIPWKEMLTNIPFLALLLTECCYRMLYWTLLMQSPVYFLEVFNYPIWKVGVVLATPHLIIWISCYPVGYMIQLFIRADIVSVTSARKFCNVLAMVVGGIAMIMMGYLDSLLGAVTMYTTSVTLGMYYLMGGHINHLDLSPRYSVLMLGFIRAAGNFSAIISHVIAFVIILDETGSPWDVLFQVLGSISIFGGIVYAVFGSAETQNYNNLPP